MKSVRKSHSDFQDVPAVGSVENYRRSGNSSLVENTCKSHVKIFSKHKAGAGRQPCKSWVTGLWPDFD